MKPSLASFFSGAGGSSLGYRRGGLTPAYANEFRPVAAATYELNLCGGRTFVDRAWIGHTPTSHILDAVAARTGRREVDVVEGSPPCQGYSPIGRRDPSDQRGAPLFMKFLRVARELRPKAIVVENVPGLAMGFARRLLEDVRTALRRSGYLVGVGELDASWLGVPQARRRIFLIAFRRDLGLDPAVGFPAPQRAQTTIGDALPGVARVVWLPRPGVQPPWDRGNSWHSSEPVGTVTASGVSGVGRSHIRIEDLDGGLRTPTVADVAALCGFPPGFSFPEWATEADWWTMLGNAVPPPMAAAVGRRIVRALRSVEGRGPRPR